MRAKKAFKVKQKAVFIIVNGLSVSKNCLKNESAPLTYQTSRHTKLTLSVFDHFALSVLKELTYTSGYFRITFALAGK